ncbi:MAG TPA: hypothetical protein VGK30_17825 [Candidatus Binatia bacterium]|jgi:hypothetical protein
MQRLTLAVISLVATLLMATIGQAKTLTTGIGFAYNAIDCRVLNATAKPIEVNSVAILDPDGNALPTSTLCTFPGSIFPGLSCSVKVSDLTEHGGGYGRCVIDTKGNAKSIRATLLLFGTGLGDQETILEAR